MVLNVVQGKLNWLHDACLKSWWSSMWSRNSLLVWNPNVCYI